MTYAKATKIAAAPWDYTLDECKQALARIESKGGGWTRQDLLDMDNLAFEIGAEL